MKKQFKVGDYWKTRDGSKVFICAIKEDSIYKTYGYPIIGVFKSEREEEFTADGFLVEGEEDDDDLIEPWVEPKEYWVNVMAHDDVAMDCSVHMTREDADLCSRINSRFSQKRVACIKFEEGDGL